MKVLSIDMDFFLNGEDIKTPRIQCVGDYKNKEYLDRKWEAINFADKAPWLDVSLITVKEVVEECAKDKTKIEVFEYHEEILEFIGKYMDKNDDSLTVINLDQHHDQHALHNQDLDCSNWALPARVLTMFENLRTYLYVWGKNKLSVDEGFSEGHLIFPRYNKSPNCPGMTMPYTEPSFLYDERYANYYASAFNASELHSLMGKVLWENETGGFDLIAICRSRAYVPPQHIYPIEHNLLYSVRKKGEVIE